MYRLTIGEEKIAEIETVADLLYTTKGKEKRSGIWFGHGLQYRDENM